MESKKIVHNPNTNSNVQNDDAEKAITSTFSESIKAMDTSRDDINPAVLKLLLETNEKLEKEKNTLKQNNDKILAKNCELAVSEASLNEKVKWYKKISFGEKIFTILIGVSATTAITLDNEIFPRVGSVIIFVISLFCCLYFYIFKKD